MTLDFSLILLLVWSTFFLWLAAVIWTRRSLQTIKDLPVRANTNGNAAPVSILLPARNEEKRVLRECVKSLFAQDYSNFEIIAVNDRSVDKTGAILHELSKINEKLIVIEGAELPENWLGKCFALQQAFEKSRGDWILITDADILFAPTALTTAICYAEESGFDALTLIPYTICESFWEKVFMPVFEWFRLMAMPFERANNPKCRESLGIGNFFLMRREVLTKLKGFTSVRAEVAEDLKLADIIKRAGFKIRLDFAPNLIKTRMYESLQDIWHGFTKNFFAALNFSMLKTFFGAASIISFGVFPLIFAIVCLMLFLKTHQIFYMAMFAPLFSIYLLQISVFAVFNRTLKVNMIYAVFAPLGLGLFAAILINSTFRILTGRGVVWKGRAIYQRN